MANSVLGYFLRNPTCVDDLEGIVRWRLLDEKVGNAVGETARALDWLVAKGLLDRLETPGLGTRYQLRTERAGEAAALLQPKAKVRRKRRGR